MEPTCSSKLCSIFCFHVETRVASSVCFSVSAMLARRASYIKKHWQPTKKIAGNYQVIETKKFSQKGERKMENIT